MMTCFTISAFSTPPISEIPVTLPTNGSAAVSVAPQDSLKYQRAFYLITSSELHKAGFTSGMNINSIGFTNAAAPDSVSKGKFKVYLQNTSDFISRKDSAWTDTLVTANKFSLSGLVKGDFEWQVIGCSGNAADTAKSSFSTNFINACNQPTNISITNITGNSVTISWVAPASSGLTAFVLQHDSSNGNLWINDTITATTKTLTGLLPNKVYKIQVISLCGADSSNIVSNFFTTETPVAACNLPTALNVTSITGSTATLTWTAAIGASRYSIQYRRANTIAWTNGISFTNSLAVSGLKSGTAYEWQIRAVCTAGNGAYVAGTSFTTTGTVVCYSPSILSADSLTESSVVLTWNGSASATYKLRYRIKSYITWSSAVSVPSAMTLVHNDSLIIPNSIGAYGVNFAGSGISTFTYSGNGLYVAFEYQHDSTKNCSSIGKAMCTYGDSIVKGFQQNDSLNFPQSFGSSNPAVFENILTANHLRPETRLGSSDLKDSVEVANVYTLRNHSSLFSNPEKISALIKNHTSIRQPFTSTMKVKNAYTGMELFSASSTDSVDAGSELLITFNGWSASVNERDSITVSIAPQTGENYTFNNSFTLIQNVNNNIVSFDDNSASVSTSGFDTLSGMLLSRFSMGGCGAVNSVQVYLTPESRNHIVYGVILDSSGTVIDTSSHFIPGTNDINRYHSFYFPSVPSFTNSDYYVGLVQSRDSVNGYYPVGVQYDGTNVRSNTFYKASISGTSLSSYALPGRLMIRSEVVNSAPSVKIDGRLSICANDTNDITALNISTRYANRIISYSSSKSGYGAEQVLGTENVYPAATINNNNWVSNTADGAREYLTLGFSNAAPVSYVDIYETFGCGAVDTVYVKNPTTSLYEVVYSGSAAPVSSSSRINHITFPLTSFNVSEIRVAINSPAVAGFNAIDAIAIGWIDNPAYVIAGYLWSTGATTKSISVSTAGVYSVNVNSGSTCNAIASVSLNALPLATVTVTTDRATTFCVGDTAVKLTSSQPFGNKWSTGETTRTITATATASYFVSYNAGLGCDTVSSTPVSVTVNPIPVVTISGALAFCPSSSTTLDAGSTYASYLWSTGATTSSISVSTANAYIVNVVSTLGCKGKRTVNVSQSSVPTPFISGNNSFCPGSSITLDAGAGYSSYSWSTLPVSTGRTLTVSSAGIYTVTVTNSSGCTGSATVNAIQHTAPAPYISGNASFCQGGSTNIFANTGFASYMWNSGATTQNISVNTAGNYTVTVTDNNGCTGTAAQTASLFPVPNPVISGNLSFCNGGSTILDAGINYAGFVWTTGATTHSITTSAIGPYSVTVTDNNGCVGSATVTTVFSNAIPALPGLITGQNTGLCSLPSTTYSIAPVALATNYVWTVPAGATILSGQGTTSINIQFPSFTAASISVVALNSCGQSPARIYQLNGIPGTLSAIAGAPNGVCRQNGISYSVTPLPSVSTYTWSMPVGATIASGQGTPNITVNFATGFSSGNICVTASNACGSVQTCKTISAIPAVPTTISGPLGVCKKATGVVYSTPAVYGATSYTWSLPPGAKITSGANTNSIIVTFVNNAGAITVKANNACGSSPAASITTFFNCRQENNTEEELNDFTIFPNPTSGKFNVVFSGVAGDEYLMQVTDLLGKILQVNTGTIFEAGNKVEIDLNDVPKGIYLLRMRINEDQITTKKIIVE